MILGYSPPPMYRRSCRILATMFLFHEKVKASFKHHSGIYAYKVFAHAHKAHINPEGSVGLMGVSENFIGINTRMVLERGLNLFGSSRSGVADFERTMEILSKNPQIPAYLENLVGEVVEVKTISDIHKAFASDISRSFGKTVLKWEK